MTPRGQRCQALAYQVRVVSEWAAENAIPIRKTSVSVSGLHELPNAGSRSLVTPSGAPAWKTIPSWFLVSKQDRIIPPEAERAVAKRAKAKTRSINSSHVAMMSHPGTVVDLIKDAAR